MSDDREVGGFNRPKIYREVDTTLTATTDVTTQFGTVRICWHEEMVINIVLGPFEPEERRVSVRRFLPPHPEGQEVVSQMMRYFLGKPTEFSVELPPTWAPISIAPFGKHCARFPTVSTRRTLNSPSASDCLQAERV